MFVPDCSAKLESAWFSEKTVYCEQLYFRVFQSG
ncbi:hypothetical protein PHLH5_07050 [Pseudomonas sp. Cab53]|nr:hypothetical protein PHLH5_07050 [Pseudomonas sp. Cab53]